MAVANRNFDDFVTKYNEKDVERITSSFPFSVERREEMRTMLQTVFEVLPTIANRVVTHDVDALAQYYSSHPNIGEHFVEWRRRRHTLINDMKTCAKELDDMEYHLTLTRTISSGTQLLTSVKMGLTTGISAAAFLVNPIFGFITKGLFMAAPWGCYAGALASIVEIKKSDLILKRIWESVRNDAESFEPLRQYLEETQQLDVEVQKLFPHRINEDLLRIINEAFSDFDISNKIFASVYIANVKEDPGLYKDGLFLNKVLEFCRSPAASVWFTRALRLGKNNIPLLSTVSFLKKELFELQKSTSNSSIVEFFNVGSRHFETPRPFQIGVNMFLLYCGYRSLKAGGKHCCSDVLRDHAKHSETFLQAMERIRNRLSPHQLNENSAGNSNTFAITDSPGVNS